MEARHPHLTTQQSFYVEISRARDRAELVTDDAAELRAQLEAATGERIAALEGIGEMPREARESAMEAPHAGTEPKWRPNRSALWNGKSRRAWTSGCDRMPRGRAWADAGIWALESARWTAGHEDAGQEAGPAPGRENGHCGRGGKVACRGERAWRRTEIRKASRC